MDRSNCYLFAIAVLLAGSLTAWAVPDADNFPAEKLEDSIRRLVLPDRTARLEACKYLTAWAEQEPDAAKARFIGLMRQSTEPEIRERCLQFLKPIAAREFGSFGEGYMGISMGNETTIQVPGEAQASYGLVINAISKGAPAEKAQLKQGDVIVSLNEHQWNIPETIMDLQQGLSAKIRAVGAGKKANLGIWRDNKLLKIEVLLTRRPSNIDQMQMQLMPNGGVRINDDELNRAVEEEKNSNVYFSEWLAKQLEKNPDK